MLLIAALLFLGPGLRAQEEEGDAKDADSFFSRLSTSERRALAALPQGLLQKLRKAARGEETGELTADEKLRISGLERPLREKVLGLFTVKKEEKGGKPPLKDAVERDRRPPKDGKDERRDTGPEADDAGEEAPVPDDAEDKGDGDSESRPSKPEPLARFGMDFFRTDSSAFYPDVSLPVFDGYVIGPGDQLVLRLWNALVDESLKLDVSRQGRIRIPKAGEVSVAGVRFGDLEKVLREKLSAVYKDAGISVTLGRLRSIRVYVVGEAARSGLFTLSSLSTLVNALSITGGPSTGGSLRRIEVRRAGKTISTFDLYDFLLRGDRSADVQLLTGDTVFLPQAGPIVAVEGEVRRPALYELRAEKTLADVIALAGGMTARSYRGSVQVERTVDGSRRELRDVPGEGLSFPVLDGDRIFVRQVDPQVRNSVTVTGNVTRPGAYEWRSGMKLSDLLRLAGGVLPGTYLDRAEIERVVAAAEDLRVPVKGIPYRPEKKLLRVNLGAVLAGDAAADAELKEMDEVRVLRLDEMRPSLTVEISGYVDNPGVYPFREGMKLTDLVFQAQQTLRPDTYMERVVVLRLIDGSRGYDYATGGQKAAARRRTLSFKLTDALSGGEKDPALRPFDRVILFAAAEVRPAPEVTIIGAVQNPLTCELTEDMRVSDLVFRAGSVLREAYLDRAEIVRRVPARGGNAAEYTVRTIEFDLGAALRGDAKHNLLLENFDRVIVKKCSEYFVSVEIEGEVRFPGIYVMKKGARLSDLILRAGGFTERAFLPGAFFTRENVKKIQEKTLKRFLAEQKTKVLELETQLSAQAVNETVLRKIQSSIEARKRLLAELEKTPVAGRLAIRVETGKAFEKSAFNLELRQGDSLRIPVVPVSITLQGEVFNPGSVLFVESKRLEYYINRAGGFREGADAERLYVIKADGSARPRSAGSGWAIRWDAENFRWVRGRVGRIIERGDIIIVPPTSTVVSGYDLTKDIVDIVFKIAMATGVVVGLF
jgi:protein involved in polysaccharide export with SLBB domain